MAVRKISLSLPDDLIAALDARAESEERSRSQVAAQAIRRAFTADNGTGSATGGSAHAAATEKSA